MTTLPKNLFNTALTHNSANDGANLLQNEPPAIPKWLEIIGSDPKKLAMFAANQLHWTSTFIPGVNEEECNKIFQGNITSLSYNVSDEILIQVLSVLVQACHEPFEALFREKPLNIKLADQKTKRAYIQFSDKRIEFRIGEENTIEAVAHGMTSFYFPLQEVLKQIQEHGSRFMSSTGLTYTNNALVAGLKTNLSSDLINVMLDAVSKQTNSKELDDAEPYNQADEDRSHYQISDNQSNELLNLALNCLPKVKRINWFSSIAHLSSVDEPRINCSPYILGNMANALNSIATIQTPSAICAA